MIVWWVTQAIPTYITALLPAVLFPLLGLVVFTPDWVQSLVASL